MAQSSLIGSLLAGSYRVDALIGRGSMGCIYAATDLRLGRRVALKIPHPCFHGDGEIAARLVHEARASCRLTTGHVARVLTLESLPSGMPFLVMELLAGEDLERLLQRKGRLPVADAVWYGLQACVALAEAHGQGIVHRDIKPGNLFLCRLADGSQRIKILDFGVSTLAPPDGRPLRRAGPVGTPLYMSPEQAIDPADCDPRSDVWSLGALLYELLGGAPPFDGASIEEVWSKLLRLPLSPLRSARPELPPGLAAAVERCLERDRAARFASAAEMAAALAPFSPRDGSHLAAQALRLESAARIRRRARALQPSAPPREIRLPLVDIPRAPVRAAPATPEPRLAVLLFASAAVLLLLFLLLLVGLVSAGG